jgi:hypothetical protein
LKAVFIASNGEGPHILRWRRVEAAERALGCRVPDDVVAAWAAVGRQEPPPGARYVIEDFSPEGAVAATNEMLARMADEGEATKRPIALFGTSVRGEYVCAYLPDEKVTESSSGETELVTLQVGADVEVVNGPTRLSEFLRYHSISDAEIAIAMKHCDRLEIRLEDEP